MHFDEVLIVVNWRRRREIDQMLIRLRRIAVPVRLLADAQLRAFIQQPICHVGTMLAVELQRPPLTRFDRVLKRLVDLLLAGVVLVVLAPLLLSVALFIKVDTSGPIFFRQKRIGFNGQSFWIFKFRTMSVLEDGLRVKQAMVNDARVTRVGRWLRWSSIDELPQLFNVLRGEMSLVGPRPHAEVHDNVFDAAVARYAWRKNVKPGITGWAQVNGSRGPTPDTESVSCRVNYDLWYMENWSLWLDLRILLCTLPILLGARNAY
jgi:Undecaprenyl-phosphate glucose phosphotransferase